MIQVILKEYKPLRLADATGWNLTEDWGLEIYQDTEIVAIFTPGSWTAVLDSDESDVGGGGKRKKDD